MEKLASYSCFLSFPNFPPLNFATIIVVALIKFVAIIRIYHVTGTLQIQRKVQALSANAY